MKTCLKSKKDNVLKKVCVIVSDPYATDDSSSDEELELPKPQKVKRIVYEIKLHPQLTKRCKDRCGTVKTPRKKSSGPKQSKKPVGVRLRPSGNWEAEITNPITKSKKPVGVRLRPSGNWAAEITNPITKAKKWLGTYKTCEEAEKAYADKKVEFDTLVSSSPDVVNSHCLLPPASAPSVNAHDSTNEVLFNFDFSNLQIPDLSFIGAEGVSMVSGANDAELDLDCFLMDGESGNLLDDFSLIDNDINVCGVENSVPSELPDCDFSDLELDFGDSKFTFADQLAPPLNIACP